MDLGVTLAAIISVAGAIATFLGIYFSRKTDTETHKTQEELAEFQILRGVVQSLSEECDRLKESLEDAGDQAERLKTELRAALTNVRILSNHARRYAPDVPFPTLEPMNNVN
jgi:hypothetical protein